MFGCYVYVLEVASYSNLRGFFRIRMLAVLAYVSATLKPYVLDPKDQFLGTLKTYFLDP